MKCRFCGKKLDEGSVFCGYCGKQQPKVKNCVKCGQEIGLDDAFCGFCGASQNAEVMIYEQDESHNTKQDETPYSNPFALNNKGDDITIIHKEQSGTKKWLKYFAIGFTCYLVLSFIIGMCSNNDVSKFSGRYSLDDAKNRNWHYIINVTKDGRCVGGLDGDKFLGYVNPISDNAFELSNAIYDSWYLFNYREGRHVGSRECFLHEIVFDIKNNRVYFNRNDYLNRDISNPDYSILSH